LKFWSAPFFHLILFSEKDKESILFFEMKEGERMLVKIVEAISERLEVKYSIRTRTKSDQFQGNKVQVLRGSILKY